MKKRLKKKRWDHGALSAKRAARMVDRAMRAGRPIPTAALLLPARWFLGPWPGTRHVTTSQYRTG